MMHRAVGNLRRTMYMGAGLGLLACNVQSLQKYKDSNSSPLVTDGVEISTSEFPSVVRLDLGDALCTGTFISSTTVITAAHCLESRNVVFFNRIPSSKLVKNSAYSRNSLSDDIGIAIFPQGTAPDQTNLLGRSPKPGESATIVGYGNSFYNTPFDEKGVGAGIRRKGLNTVHRLNGEIVSLKANPTAESRSICGSGDSGGPLLIEGKIAAVTSARTLDRSPPECLYVDLSGRRSQIFLQNAARQGAEIPGISASGGNNNGIGNGNSGDDGQKNKTSPAPNAPFASPPRPSPPTVPLPVTPPPINSRPPNGGPVASEFGWSVEPSVSMKGCYCTRDRSGKFCVVFKDNHSRAWTRLEGSDCESDCRTYLKYDLKSCETE